MAEMKASPRNKTLGKVADKLARLRDLANKYEVLPQVPLLGGTGIGDLLMGQAPEEISNWSYGNAPMQVPEMTRIPQMKTGRGQSVADAMFLGADVGALGGLAASLGRRGLSEFVGSAGRAGVVGPEPQLGVVKPKGGNWNDLMLQGALNPLKKPVVDPDTRVDRAIQYLDPATIAAVRANQAPNAAINSWIDKTLQKYVRNEMATPEDPVRLLAERGILHRPLDPDELLDDFGNQAWVSNEMANDRDLGGFPVRGMAKSDLAKVWENASDEAIWQNSAKSLLKNTTEKFGGKTPTEVMPWLEKVDPNTPVYSAFSLRGEGLGFDHLIDELTNAMNPDSGLPADLLLKYESLPKVTVPQAVERVAKINEWRAKQKVEADMMRAMNPATQVFKEYPDQGYKWVELRMPEATGKTITTDLTAESDPQFFIDRANEAAYEEGLEEGSDAFDDFVSSYIDAMPYDPETGRQIMSIGEDESAKALRDALKYEGETMGHCVGGYCPDVIEGRSRIFSLRDAKGMPHVTVEVQPPGMRNDALFDAGIDFEEQAAQEIRRQNPRIDDESDEYMMNVMDRAQELADEWNAKQAAVKQPRIVQIKGKGDAKPKDDYLPFIQDFVKSQQWGDVGDLGNTGLRRTRDVFNDTELEKLKNEGQELGDYLVPEEIDNLQKLFGQPPQNFAQGGLVTQYDPARIEALVSQLMDE